MPKDLTSAATDTRFFGHPAGLSTLFFTEMWERFSYYGMRAILLLFMTTSVAQGGLGWDAATAGPLYGLYTALVYLTALPGGWIADRLVGQRRAVLIGGIIIALGHLSLTFHSMAAFYLGLFLIVVGTGLLKPNISTMVGSLYTQNDQRRDSGFSIFYMGINLGAFLAPLVCGYLAQSESFKGTLRSMGFQPEDSWHWGFGAAAVGMGLGLVQYVLGGRRLGRAGLVSEQERDPAAYRKDLRSFWIAVGAAALVLAALAGLQAAGMIHLTTEGIVDFVGWVLILFPVAYFLFLLTRPGWTPVERRRLGAIVLFFVFATLFWAAFEQAGSTLTLFAERNTRTSLLGFDFPSSWFQSVNSLFIIFLLGPLFAWLWVRLGSREPSSPAKFAWGLFFATVGFAIMIAAARASGPEGSQVSPLWLLTVYFVHTVGELCLSPVGLSTMTKLSPERVVGQMMGVWFLASACGNFLSGQAAGFFESLPLDQLFGRMTIVGLAFTVLAVALIRPIRKLMGGVH
ncbi:MAG TPA: peptide MFS transporter [Thermoanaerobaculia bacterium]|nr:peptide MFS transporter [Thermoanaerobaculia bacterium]